MLLLSFICIPIRLSRCIRNRSIAAMADQPFLADAEDDGSSRLRITGRRRASAASAAQNAAMTEEPVEKAYGRTSMADMQPETRQAATDSKHTSKWKAHTRLRRTAWTILKPCLTALTMLICIVLYLCAFTHPLPGHWKLILLRFRRIGVPS